MSDVKTDKSTRQPFTAKVDPMEFAADFSGMYISSSDFCKHTNEYFRGVFADYVGCTFDLGNGGQPSISLYFSHGKVEEDLHYACERVDGKQVGNSLIDATRSRDLRLKEGDRYHISEDGIDIIKPLLLPRFYNQGKPQWKQIVTDIIDRGATNYYNPQTQQQLTKIVGIDPKAICGILYGTKDGDSYIDYGITVVGNLTLNGGFIPGQTPNANYELSITKAYVSNLSKTYEKLGYAIGGGSNIIRG